MPQQNQQQQPATQGVQAAQPAVQPAIQAAQPATQAAQPGQNQVGAQATSQQPLQQGQQNKF